MNLREAAKQALEALEDSHQNINPERRYADELTRQIADAITPIRAALAENVPETNFGNMAQTVDSKESDHVADTGKTSDQSEDARGMVATSQESRQVEPVETINKMETVEPVAWCIVENGRVKGLVKSKPAVMNAYLWQPLYTAPPKREPLTDEEIAALLSQSAGVDLKLNGGDLLFARALERAHGIGGGE